MTGGLPAGSVNRVSPWLLKRVARGGGEFVEPGFGLRHVAVAQREPGADAALGDLGCDVAAGQQQRRIGRARAEGGGGQAERPGSGVGVHDGSARDGGHVAVGGGQEAEAGELGCGLLLHRALRFEVRRALPERLAGDDLLGQRADALHGGVQRRDVAHQPVLRVLRRRGVGGGLPLDAAGERRGGVHHGSLLRLVGGIGNQRGERVGERAQAACQIIAGAGGALCRVHAGQRVTADLLAGHAGVLLAECGLQGVIRLAHGRRGHHAEACAAGGQRVQRHGLPRVARRPRIGDVLRHDGKLRLMAAIPVAAVPMMLERLIGQAYCFMLIVAVSSWSAVVIILVLAE